MSDRLRLAAAFCEELLDATRPADPRLEQDLAAACARGRAAFAKVVLEDGRFVRHLARVLARDSKDAGALPALAIEDLYLACACLEGDASATTTFRTRHRGAIYEAISGIVSPADAEDVREQFVQDLLVGTEAADPKIASYSGKASLDRWVGVAARRAALMWLRRHQTEGRLRRAVAADPAGQGDPNVESAYIKERYRGEFEQALTEALKRLPERDRVVLRLSLVNGVSVEKIGTMYKVSQSTVSRWLAAARSALLDDVKETLRRRLGASSNELASLARMVASRLELTLPSFLKDT
jgi:RNA polymerase sigma-70 factor (ECF subfamily)